MSTLWLHHCNFNPRTLQESATINLRYFLVAFAISIHAPYKRVRPCAEPACQSLVDFNPRTLQESAALSRTEFFNRFEISIHAPYKRVRLSIVPLLSAPSFYFNPRTLQESATSRLGDRLQRDCQISIHAPYKRVRPCKLHSCYFWCVAISIHAPYKRVRQQALTKLQDF